MGAVVSCDNKDYPDLNLLDRKCYKKCPDGYRHDINNFSRCVLINGPQPYTRDVGSPLICPDGKVNEMGLCYTPCQKGLKGMGSNCEYDYREIGPPEKK